MKLFLLIAIFIFVSCRSLPKESQPSWLTNELSAPNTTEQLYYFEVDMKSQKLSSIATDERFRTASGKQLFVSINALDDVAVNVQSYFNKYRDELRFDVNVYRIREGRLELTERLPLQFDAYQLELMDLNIARTKELAQKVSRATNGDFELHKSEQDIMNLITAAAQAEFKRNAFTDAKSVASCFYEAYLGNVENKYNADNKCEPKVKTKPYLNAEASPRNLRDQGFELSARKRALN